MSFGDYNRRMKIVHISLSGPYTEGWSYHENMLPYWHKKLGNDVVLIARDTKYVKDSIVHCEPQKKVQDNGVILYRIRIKDKKINSWIRPKKFDLLNILFLEKPEVIWVHGVLNHFIDIVADYKKMNNNDVIIVADNHTDFYNYGTDFLRKINLIHFRTRLKKIDPQISIYYGVTPGRVDFLSTELGIDKKKIKLSLQGGNPDEINYAAKDTIRLSFRRKYNIPDDSFIYVTGGKLDQKKKILELIHSYSESKSSNTRLIIFGSISSDCSKAFEDALKKDSRIVFLGWLNSEETSNVFLSSDLGIFPGGHSVLWEKALACGLACCFESRTGFEHVFMGGAIKLQKENGNILFDYDSFPTNVVFKNIHQKIQEIRYCYLYDSIAKSSLDDFYLLKKSFHNFND